MLNIVLYEPEIPTNTGNIMRTCVATNTRLHLIEPLGFSLDEKSIKRSGVNYIDKLEYYVYKDFYDFKSKRKHWPHIPCQESGSQNHKERQAVSWFEPRR